MSEKVKNGEDIVLDGVTLLQSTDFSKEKAQESVEETKVEETPVSELITPDTVVSEIKNEEPVQTEVSLPEMPEIETTPTVEIPVSADIPKIDIAGLDTPESPISIETPAMPEFDFGNVNPIPVVADESASMDNNLFSNVVPEQANDYNDFSAYQTPATNQASNVSLFDDTYNNEDNEKVTATVVTEQDEINAKRANMEAYERLYDAGPGNQIRILRQFSEESAKWMRIVDKSGFVSGEMHDMAKKILREYEGLGAEQEFADDKVSKFSSQSNFQEDQYGGFGGFSNENVIPFNQVNSNFENGQDDTRGFAA